MNDDLIQSDPEVVAEEIRRFNGDTITNLCRLGDEILSAYGFGFASAGCARESLSQFGSGPCNNRPTVMLDADGERTFNLDNMEFELCGECFRRHVKGDL